MPLLPLSDYTVGKEVRVTGGKAQGSSSCRGMISYVNEDDTYDIIFQTSNGTQDEENSVFKDRLFDILPFEVEPLSSLDDPAIIKGYANELFQLQDYDTAYHYYIRAHKLIQQGKSFSIGQRLIISIPSTRSRCDEQKSEAVKKSNPMQKVRSGKYVSVTVSDVINASEVDVMYDEEVHGRDEEEGVSACRVLMIVSAQTGMRN
jgi:hypothetical protein